MITNRERFLMLQWSRHSEENDNIQEWLDTVIDDMGHTVEQHLSHEADEHEKLLEDK